MFKGSMKYNLDPSGEFIDEKDMLDVLEKAELGELIKKDGLKFEIEENGSNLSSG